MQFLQDNLQIFSVIFIALIALAVVLILLLFRQKNKLYESHSTLDQILNSLEAYVFYKDDKNVILKANKKVADAFNLKTKDFEGKHSREFYPEMADKYFQDDLQVIQSGEAKLNIIETIQDENGVVSLVKTDKIPVKDNDGNFKSILVVASDITELKNLQEELEETTALFEAAQQITNVGHWYFDIKANSLDWSEEVYRIHGLDSQTFTPNVEMGVSLYHPDDQDFVSKAINKALEKKINFNFKKRLIRPSGEIVHVHAKSLLDYDSDGNFKGLMGVFLDITDMIKSEERLNLQKQELEKSNKDLEEFAYVVSHDLQEPLRIVNAYLDLFISYCSENGLEINEKADKYLYYMRSSTQRMRTMILDILDFSRVGKRGLLEPVNLNEILKLAQENLHTIIEKEKASIMIEGDLPVIWGRRTELLQLFQNFLSNSLRYRSNRDPVIKISVNKIDNSNWEFTIEDNGIGIQEEFFERIFLIFQRLSRNDDDGGSGIGLTLCKKIIDLHDGEVRIESEFGSWTKFIFNLKHLSNIREPAGVH